MESEAMISRYMKVEAQPPTSGVGGLSRQGSMSKSSCLCSPTTHAGSFRCRLHRATSLYRTKSLDSHSELVTVLTPSISTAKAQ